MGTVIAAAMETARVAAMAASFKATEQAVPIR